MYAMKDVCKQVNIPYETLKYYCNEGLIPNVKRDNHNYRIFDERDIIWIKGLLCLKRCGMSISEMKQYKDLCLEGKISIPTRKRMLDRKKVALLEKMKEVEDCITYIDDKQRFYDDVLKSKIPYESNLINVSKGE